MKPKKVGFVRMHVGFRRCILAALILLVGASGSYAQNDSSTVKIIADESVTGIMLGQDTVEIDAYGNPYAPNSWFILNLPPGDYQIRFLSSDGTVTERTVAITAGEIATIDLRERPVETPEPGAPDSGQVFLLDITSDPDGCFLSIDEDTTLLVTPCTVALSSGRHSVQAALDGWQPLTDTLDIDPRTSDGLHILLKTAPPEPLTPESQGLMYEMELPLIDMREADVVKSRFNDMAETFAIFPLAQGAVFKGLLADDAPGVADAMLISGIVLTGGSILLGNFLAGRKVAEIEKRNAEIEEQNTLASSENNEIDRVLRIADRASYQAWKQENVNRGRIIVRRK